MTATKVEMTRSTMMNGLGVVHPQGSQPPSDPHAFVQAASVASVGGLDLGSRRRVGYVRAVRGSVEVVGFEGDVTPFPNSHQPWVGALSGEQRDALLKHTSTVR